LHEFPLQVQVRSYAYSWRPLPARQFGSLSELLAEAFVSGVYAGIHYRFTQEVSIAMGIELGDEIDTIRVVGPAYQ